MCPEARESSTPSSAGWQALLAGSLRDRARAAVDDIARALASPPVAWIPDFNAEPYRIARGVSLHSGAASLALFYAYCDKSQLSTLGCADQLTKCLEYVGGALEVTRLEPDFMHGLSGVLWSLDHIATFTGEPLEGLDDAMADADAFLAEHALAEEGFDLWSGLCGYGIYALPRAGEPSARRLLDSLVESLLSTENQEPGVAPWVLRPQLLRRPHRAAPRFPHTHLGVAHGIVGVVGFLAEAHRRGLGAGKIPDVCDRAWRWLDAQKSTDDRGPFWPNFAAPGTPPARGMEMWCNGMPGIATALLAAARKLGHDEMRAWCIARAHELAMLARNSPPLTDISLCHGTAGLGHMFNRFFQHTGDELFADTARAYLQLTLDQQRPGYGVGGFAAYGLNLLGDYVDLFDPGLMMGSSGVGLALLAGVSGQVPLWDRALLLS
mgnify:CR=1 FL=1